MKHDWEPVDNQGYTLECMRCGAHIYIESPEWTEEFDADCPEDIIGSDNTEDS